MKTVLRRVIQAGAVALIALTAIAEVNVTLYSDHITWQLTGPSGWPWYLALVDILPGSAFILAGLVARSLRPTNRVGLLMIGVGAGLLIGSHAFEWRLGPVALGPLVLDVVGIVGSLWPVVLLHLLLAFPGGLLVSRLDRVLVRLFYVVLPLAALLPLVFGYPGLGHVSQYLPV